MKRILPAGILGGSLSLSHRYKLSFKRRKPANEGDGCASDLGCIDVRIDIERHHLGAELLGSMQHSIYSPGSLFDSNRASGINKAPTHQGSRWEYKKVKNTEDQEKDLEVKKKKKNHHRHHTCEWASVCMYMCTSCKRSVMIRSLR